MGKGGQTSPPHPECLAQVMRVLEGCPGRAVGGLWASKTNAAKTCNDEICQSQNQTFWMNDFRSNFFHFIHSSRRILFRLKVEAIKVCY